MKVVIFEEVKTSSPAKRVCRRQETRLELKHHSIIPSLCGSESDCSMAPPEIDDSFYNRQRYILGDDAMHKIALSRILVYGMGALGIEIAKNLVLAGVHTVVVQDSQVSAISDLGIQFYLTKQDIEQKINRAVASSIRLAELNPYVKVTASTRVLDDDADLSFLSEFDCVVLTEAPLDIQIRVDEFCRSFEPPIKFISADVYGVFCCVFCDFGNVFEVFDPTGEEPVKTFIGHISKSNPGIVTCLESSCHCLETGDIVYFSEVHGMNALNGLRCTVEVLSSQTFAIGDTFGDEFGEYEGGGIFQKVTQQEVLVFNSLENELMSPTLTFPDLGKTDMPLSIHLGFLALHSFWKTQQALPKPWDSDDAKKMVMCAQNISDECTTQTFPVFISIIEKLSVTAQGLLPPLAAFLGGVVAQEVLKATTGKFSPLHQWLHVDCCELVPDMTSMRPELLPPLSRYEKIIICIGENMVEKLADMNVFLVGCGAIGCEALKNYALLGVGTRHGMITVTDNDTIEKSNLNRQFLFKASDIQKSKSSVAAKAIEAINSDVRVDPHQWKVSPQSNSIYNDDFYERQTILVTALDNIEGRRYIDSLSVKYSRPLLDSGTMGTKGHVQVVIPHQTETYGSQSDPIDESIPYCTLKSFPASIEHTIQWARDKFESLYYIKPLTCNKFWNANNHCVELVLSKLENEEELDNLLIVMKIMKKMPKTFVDCIKLARMQFEKYFNHKAHQLLYSIPLDTKMKDGSMFWQLPKRAPTPLKFDKANKLHLDFIKAMAHLLACVYVVPMEEMSENRFKEALDNCVVPEFVPRDKKIETDESVVKPEENGNVSLLDSMQCAKEMRANKAISTRVLCPLKFDKDNDADGHIDFIHAASNLRAAMYGIEPADRFHSKRIAGKIIPAIATTTSAVAGLATLELLKVVKDVPLENHRNSFLNLALPIFVFSEPAPVPRTQVSESRSYTLWDRWDFHKDDRFTLQDLVNELNVMSSSQVTLVTEGQKMIYIPNFYGLDKLKKTMISIFFSNNGKKYVDLTVAFQRPDEKDVMGPPIRYFLP